MHILLVGNSGGREPPLEGYDVVYRMNNYPKNLRCDIWINNLIYTTPQPDIDQKALRLNYMNGGGHAKRFPKNWEVTSWDCEGYERLRKEWKLEAPSTGAMAWFYLINYTSYKIDVAGFDHTGWDTHNWKKERDILNQLEKESKINHIWRDENEIPRPV
jgi:hypothetical protein